MKSNMGGNINPLSTANAVTLSLERERVFAEFVDYCNQERYHESLDNLTPADVYQGRRKVVLTRREEIKMRTLTQGKRLNLQPKHV